MVIYLSLLIALVGILMEALSANGKIVSIGRDMFWVGLLAFLLKLGPDALSVLKG
jgi:hypothetical protein